VGEVNVKVVEVTVETSVVVLIVEVNVAVRAERTLVVTVVSKVAVVEGEVMVDTV
jgi:hydrogenase/urease accessory protein HupE